MDESIITSNDLILKRILQFTDYEDLLRCRLVNKRWKSFAGSVLLRERKCLAKIGSVKPCQELLNLNDFLKSSHPAPFNGLSMSYSYHFIEECLHDKDLLRQSYSSILELLPIKYLHIILDQYTECLAMEFIKLLVRDRGPEIQELQVSITEFEFSSLQEFFQFSDSSSCNWLPNLISLEMKTEIAEHVLLEIIAGAPKLQKIFGSIRPDHLSELMRLKKTDLIKEFHLSIVQGNVRLCQEFSRVEPKIQRLSVSSQSLRESAAKFVPEILPSVFNASSSTLEVLDIEHLDLIMLVSTTSFCLENLRSLTIQFNLGLDRFLGFFSLSRINFQVLFPNLKSCKISTSRYSYSTRDKNMIPNAFKNSDDFYKSSITDLSLKGTPFKPVSLSSRIPLGTVFPKVKHAQIQSCLDTWSYLDFLLSSWPELESLEIKMKEDPSRLTNLDPLFCGISEQEAIYLHSLEQNDPGFLKNYQMAPIRRSLLHSNNLKTLKIKVKHADRCPVVRNRSSFLTTVSGQLVFARFTDLRVEIHRSVCRKPDFTNCCFYSGDLHQFARITSGPNCYYPPEDA